MDDMILCLFVCLVIPIAMSMLILNGKSRSLILFMVFGMFMCLFAGQINSLIQNLSRTDTYTMTTSVTPVVEEILKAIPILTLYLLYKPERQFLLECSVMIGLGFSLLENVFILLNSVSHLTFIMALFRGLGSAMLHVATAVSVGFGISRFGIRKKTLIPGVYAVLLAAMVFHAVYNMFVQSDKLVYFGIILPVLAFIPFVIYISRHKKSDPAVR